MAYCGHPQFKEEALDMSNICDQCGTSGTKFACKDVECECTLCSKCHEIHVLRKEEPKVEEEKTEDLAFELTLKEAAWLLERYWSLEEQRTTKSGGAKQFKTLETVQAMLKDKNYDELVKKVEGLSCKVETRQRLQLWAAVRKVATAMFGPRSLKVTKIIEHLGLAHLALQEYEAAKANFEDALVNYKRKGTSQDLPALLTTVHLGNVLEKLGEKKKAKAQIKFAKEGLEKTDLLFHSKVPEGAAYVYKRIGALHVALEEPTEAEAMYNVAARIYKDFMLHETEAAADCQAKLWHLHLGRNNDDTARKCLQQACAVYKKIGQPNELLEMILKASAEVPKEGAEPVA